jgi:hypothetical protein
MPSNARTSLLEFRSGSQIESSPFSIELLASPSECLANWMYFLQCLNELLPGYAGLLPNVP